MACAVYKPCIISEFCKPHELHLKEYMPCLYVKQYVRRPVNYWFDTGPLFCFDLISLWLRKEQPVVSKGNVTETKATVERLCRVIVSGLCCRLQPLIYQRHIFISIQGCLLSKTHSVLLFIFVCTIFLLISSGIDIWAVNLSVQFQLLSVFFVEFIVRLYFVLLTRFHAAYVAIVAIASRPVHPVVDMQARSGCLLPV